MIALVRRMGKPPKPCAGLPRWQKCQNCQNGRSKLKCLLVGAAEPDTAPGAPLSLLLSALSVVRAEATPRVTRKRASSGPWSPGETREPSRQDRGSSDMQMSRFCDDSFCEAAINRIAIRFERWAYVLCTLVRLYTLLAQAYLHIIIIILMFFILTIVSKLKNRLRLLGRRTRRGLLIRLRPHA
jgi:hypothetical protein